MCSIDKYTNNLAHARAKYTRPPFPQEKWPGIEASFYGADIPYKLASNPRRLKYGLVVIAWVLVHMRDTITQNLGNPYRGYARGVVSSKKMLATVAIHRREWQKKYFYTEVIVKLIDALVQNEELLCSKL